MTLIIHYAIHNLHYEKFQDGTVKCIEDEVLFEVPEGWTWCRLRNICMMSAGKAKPTAYIKTEPFEGSFECYGGNGVRGYVDEYNYEGIFSIVGRQGALCGNINIASGRFYATEHAVVTTLFSGIDFLWSNYILEALELNKYATGAAQPGLSVANVLNIFIAVPPENEQKQIAKSIKSSLENICTINAKKNQLQESITQCKSKILDLAISGKLIPQDPTDEPASVLLERIRAEKEELIKKGKIKRDKNDSVIYKGDDNSYYEKFKDGTVKCINNEIPFEVPNGWGWTRLNVLGKYRKGPFGSSITKSMFVPDGPDSIKVYEQKNAINKDASLGSYFITNQKFQSLKSFEVFSNDIIVSCAGTIGETYVLPLNIRQGIINQALMKITLFDLNILDFYLLYFDSVLKKTASSQGHGVALKNIPPFNVLKQYLIPLPPLTEQKRILATVTKSFSLLDSILLD